MMVQSIADSLRELYRAMLAHDIPGLDALLAEDCTYVHSTGLAETKAELLEGVRTGLYEYERVRPTSETIKQSDDIAVVYSLLDFVGGPKGQPHAPTTLITTLVWVRHGGDTWRLMLRQATRVP